MVSSRRQWCRFAVALSYLLVLNSATGNAQPVEMAAACPEVLRLTERSNISRRDDGRYVGLINILVTGNLSISGEIRAVDVEFQATYDGLFLRFEQTRRDMSQVARPVDQSIQTSIIWSSLSPFYSLSPYPALLRIPTLPSRPIAPGMTWNAPGVVNINPLNDESNLYLPVYVEYRYDGIDQLDGKRVYSISGRFATRYPLTEREDPDDGSRDDIDSDRIEVPPYEGPIAGVAGSHVLTILVPAEEGATLLIRDELAEQYRFADGHTVDFAGHRLLFVDGLDLSRRQSVIENLEQLLDDPRAADIVVETTSAGARVTLQNIHFVADQATILPDERGRLDTLADALLRIDNGRFLIVGHTADVGTVDSQVRLSVDRAERIAAELVARGVDPNRIDLEGRGGSEPIGDNTTDAGRALNRRVEIYVLE